MFKFPIFIEVVARIINIAKSIKVDDPKKKFGGVRRWLVAKASSFKPTPKILYIEAQMNWRHVSWADKKARQSFMSPKLTRELELTDS